MPERIRVCKECGDIKPIREFGMRDNKYIRYHCNDCHSKKRKQYNQVAYRNRKERFMATK